MAGIERTAAPSDMHHCKITGVDLYTLPKSKPRLAKRKDGKLIPGTLDLTLGDLDANPFKLLWPLFHEGIISGIDENEYKRLVAITAIPQHEQTPQDDEYFVNILAKIKITASSNITLTCIGDFFFDRFHDDRRTAQVAKALETASAASVAAGGATLKIIDVYSNHVYHLLQWYHDFKTRPKQIEKLEEEIAAWKAGEIYEELVNKYAAQTFAELAEITTLVQLEEALKKAKALRYSAKETHGKESIAYEQYSNACKTLSTQYNTLLSNEDTQYNYQVHKLYEAYKAHTKTLEDKLSTLRTKLADPYSFEPTLKTLGVQRSFQGVCIRLKDKIQKGTMTNAEAEAELDDLVKSHLSRLRLFSHSLGVNIDGRDRLEKKTHARAGFKSCEETAEWLNSLNIIDANEKKLRADLTAALRQGDGNNSSSGASSPDHIHTISPEITSIMDYCKLNHSVDNAFKDLIFTDNEINLDGLGKLLTKTASDVLTHAVYECKKNNPKYPSKKVGEFIDTLIDIDPIAYQQWLMTSVGHEYMDLIEADIEESKKSDPMGDQLWRMRPNGKIFNDYQTAKVSQMGEMLTAAAKSYEEDEVSTYSKEAILALEKKLQKDYPQKYKKWLDTKDGLAYLTNKPTDIDNDVTETSSRTILENYQARIALLRTNNTPAPFFNLIERREYQRQEADPQPAEMIEKSDSEQMGFISHVNGHVGPNPSEPSDDLRPQVTNLDTSTGKYQPLLNKNTTITHGKKETLNANELCLWQETNTTLINWKYKTLAGCTIEGTLPENVIISSFLTSTSVEALTEEQQKKICQCIVGYCPSLSIPLQVENGQNDYSYTCSYDREMYNHYCHSFASTLEAQEKILRTKITVLSNRKNSCDTLAINAATALANFLNNNASTLKQASTINKPNLCQIKTNCVARLEADTKADAPLYNNRILNDTARGILNAICYVPVLGWSIGGVRMLMGKSYFFQKIPDTIEKLMTATREINSVDLSVYAAG